MTYPRVQGVVTQQGNDVSDLINRYAEAEACDAVGLLAGLISESNLNEQAERLGRWPDWSEGLGQQTLLYASVGDHTATAANLQTCRDYYWQPENAIREAAALYGAYYQQYSDYFEAWSRYNGGPTMAYSRNPNAANIRRGWDAAQAYLEASSMVDYDAATFMPSPNFQPGRGGHVVTAIVLHGTAGQGAVSWFQNPASQVSAHYVVEQNGSVVQCVREADTAWHAGVVTPDSRFYGGTNPNAWTIGIEHTRDKANASPLTPVQLGASLDLVGDILSRYGPLALLTHDEIDVGRICPGPGFPLAAFEALLNGGGEDDSDMAYRDALSDVTKRVAPDVKANIEKALAVPRLPAKAREALQAGALPGIQFICDQAPE